MKTLAILGASGHGKVVADIAEICGWEQICFFDDAWPGLTVNEHWPVSGNFEQLMAQYDRFDGIVVAIGNNLIRFEKLSLLKKAGAPLVTLIHPSSVISKYAVIGAGSVVCAGVVVNAFSVVGMGAILNTSCTIDHDCQLGYAVHVSPGAHLGGAACIGDLSWIGIGASVRQLIQIGRGSVIGAGAAVVGHIPDNVVVAGVPAKKMG